MVVDGFDIGTYVAGGNVAEHRASVATAVVEILLAVNAVYS